MFICWRCRIKDCKILCEFAFKTKNGFHEKPQLFLDHWCAFISLLFIKLSDEFWQYNTFQYWRNPLPPIDLADIEDVSEDSLTETALQGKNEVAEIDMESWQKELKKWVFLNLWRHL